MHSPGKMSLVRYYFFLTRPVNLVIIALTQVMMRFFMLNPLLKDSGSISQLRWWEFMLLVFATVLIAAAGYVINDVNDIGMDHINRPSKRIVGKIIRAEAAETYYFVLNIIGIICGIIVSGSIGKWELSLVFVIIATMLYYYTLKYQYLTFWGNLVVSVLASAVIGVLWLFEFFAFRADAGSFVDGFQSFSVIGIFTAAYMIFAFMTTMSREMIKDLQDRDGDAKNGCMTIPVRYGEKATRIVLIMIHVILLAGLILFQVWLSGRNYQALSYSLILPQILIIYISLRLILAKDIRIYKISGNLMKVTMILGLLSMIFIIFR